MHTLLIFCGSKQKHYVTVAKNVVAQLLVLTGFAFSCFFVASGLRWFCPGEALKILKRSESKETVELVRRVPRLLQNVLKSQVFTLQEPGLSVHPANWCGAR